MPLCIGPFRLLAAGKRKHVLLLHKSPEHTALTTAQHVRSHNINEQRAKENHRYLSTLKIFKKNQKSNGKPLI